MSRPIVGVVMGSDSGPPVMFAAAEALAGVDVSHEVRVVSAPYPAAPHTTCSPTPTAPTDAACVS
jgi:phosphoribosylcarboxyaminoimidazole (NCAIR) mutase